MSDAGFKGAPYCSHTTAELRAFIAIGQGNDVMRGEIVRRARRDAGDVSVVSDGERLHWNNKKASP